MKNKNLELQILRNQQTTIISYFLGSICLSQILVNWKSWKKALTIFRDTLKICLRYRAKHGTFRKIKISSLSSIQKKTLTRQECSFVVVVVFVLFTAIAAPMCCFFSAIFSSNYYTSLFFSLLHNHNLSEIRNWILLDDLIIIYYQ